MAVPLPCAEVQRDQLEYESMEDEENEEDSQDEKDEDLDSMPTYMSIELEELEELEGLEGLEELEEFIPGSQIDMNQLSTILCTTKEATKSLTVENEELKTRAFNLKKKVKTLEASLILNTIAASLETSLINYVLQDCSCDKKYLTISQVDIALNDLDSFESEGIFQTDEEMQLARKRWKKLNEIYQITAVHYGIIQEMQRNDEYTRTMTLKEAEESIKIHVSDETQQKILLEVTNALQIISTAKE